MTFDSSARCVPNGASPSKSNVDTPVPVVSVRIRVAQSLWDHPVVTSDQGRSERLRRFPSTKNNDIASFSDAHDFPVPASGVGPEQWAGGRGER